jgi:hypothetical protein
MIITMQSEKVESIVDFCFEMTFYKSISDALTRLLVLYVLYTVSLVEVLRCRF